MIEEEEVETLGFQVRVFPWYDDQEAASSRSSSGTARSDAMYPGATRINVADVMRLRITSFTRKEIER